MAACGCRFRAIRPIVKRCGVEMVRSWVGRAQTCRRGPPTAVAGQSYGRGILAWFKRSAGLGPVGASGPEPRDDPPWHLVDLWWTLPGAEREPFERLTLPFWVSDDLPDSALVYIAPNGVAHPSGVACYGGVQTQSDGNTDDDPDLQGIGRGLLMSMWGERSRDAIRAVGEPGRQFWQSSGHEGDFVSVRRSFPWTAGAWEYEMRALDTDRGATWVGAYLRPLDGPMAGTEVEIGALRFPASPLRHSASVAAFVEVYGPRIPVAEIPSFRVRFDAPRVNGAVWPGTQVNAIYPSESPDLADASAVDRAVLVEVGQWKARANRSERLF